MKNAVTIFWFRRDLRCFDNKGFFMALKDELPVIPLFIFDTNILNDLSDKYDKRVNFIYHRLHDLNSEFLKHGSSLLIRKGKPLDVFRNLLQEYDVQKVYTNHDYEPYAINRDKDVHKLLKENNAGFYSFKDQVIFEKSEITKDDGTPYSVYTPYSKAWKKQFTENDIQEYPCREYLHNLLNQKYDFPIMEETGFKPSFIDYPSAQPSQSVIEDYHKTRDFPAEEGTSRIGVHLRFGTVSPRQMIRLARKWNQTWLDELIWREFFMMILYHNPHVIEQEYKPKYRMIPWRKSESDFQRWKDGLTGYPIVDAGMRELSETGYMHNRVRMITASFLTKHLLIDWRLGEAWFAEKLLDYELASNNGNWQWAAGTGCDAAPYFRIFNPTTQVKKFDPQKKYILKWVPELNSSAYPKPIIPHKQARERALNTYKQALNNAE
jgi:deoxyribodipyrimidine photo-lyase